MASRSKSHMGGSKSKSKKSASSGDKPHEMHIKRVHGGGFLVKHHHKARPDGLAPESTDHVISDPDQLQQHVADNMGDQPPAGTPMPPQGPPQGGSPMSGM